jgi:hypothetical protein
MRVKCDRKPKRLSVFSHAQEKPFGFVYEWSRERAPIHFIVSADGEREPVHNPNMKEFSTKPRISMNRMISAYNFKIEHDPVFIKLDNLYMTSNVHSNFDKKACKNYIWKLYNWTETCFDGFMAFVNSFYVIDLNFDEWENSLCTCKDSFKDYVCDHVIILAAKLDLCSFEEAAMKKPMGPKPKRGPKAKMNQNFLAKPKETTTQGIYQFIVISFLKLFLISFILNNSGT